MVRDSKRCRWLTILDFVSEAKSDVRPNVQGVPSVEDRSVIAYSPSKAPAIKTLFKEAMVVMEPSNAVFLLRSMTASAGVPSRSVRRTF